MIQDHFLKSYHKALTHSSFFLLVGISRFSFHSENDFDTIKLHLSFSPAVGEVLGHSQSNKLTAVFTFWLGLGKSSRS